MTRVKLSAFALLVLLVSAKVQAADTGYVHCRAAEEYVYLYQSTATFQVAANLKCGQKVEVIDSQNSAWVRVRTADGKEGYLPQGAIVLETQQSTTLQTSAAVLPSPKPVSEAPSPAAAVRVPLSLDESDTPRVEVSGGYSYLNADTSGLSTGRQNVNGFESSVTVNATSRLAAEANVSGYFQTYSADVIALGAGTINLGEHDYAFMGGPRYNAGKFFVHGLLGVDRISLSVLGSSLSQNSFAAAFGGGAEWTLSRHLALKASGDWVLTRHDLDNLVFPGGPAYTQNNIRVSVGIVYRAGSLFSSGR